MTDEKKIDQANETPVFKYETKSLDEFAVLLSLGAEVVSVDRVTDSKFYRFSLSSGWDMEKTTLELASKKLTVNAYELCEAMRRAKSIVHSR